MELERKKAFLLRAGYATVLGLSVWLFLRYVLPLVLPVLLGFAVAFFLQPLCRFLQRHAKIGARGAAVAALVLFYAAATVLLWGALALLLFAGERFIQALPQWYASLRPAFLQWNEWLLVHLNRLSPHTGWTVGQLLQSWDAALEAMLLTLSAPGMELLNRWAGGLPLFVVALLVTVFASFFVTVQYGHITAFFLRQIPQRLHGTIRGTGAFLLSSLGKLCKAYTLLTAITFVVLLAGFWVLRVPNPALPAALIAVMDALPVLGSGLALVPWGIYRLCLGEYFMGGGLLALWVVLIVLRQLLQPKLIGDQLGQHPLLTLAAMYAGLRLAGFGGLLLGPVVCFLLQYLHDEGVVRLYKEPKKGT